MENGLPMLNCLLQHTLRSLCSSSDSSSKWVYAVFWRIIPRNYPPPKWNHGGGLLDRAKENKRNWILVWEDGFCDFCECESAETTFGADIFFKMSHEVYNFGEGLVGKVASDNSHKWVFKDSPQQNDHNTFISSWNVSIDHAVKYSSTKRSTSSKQPRAWEAQFSSGIETIAIISVKDGAIQLGSFDKVVEDLNMVLSIQRKFSYIQSIPGIYAMQRPNQPIQDPNFFDYNNAQRLMQTSGFDDHKYHAMGSKRQTYEQIDDLQSPTKSVYLGYNSPHNGNCGSLPLWPIPPLLPSVPCNPRAFFTKMPSAQAPCHGPDGIDHGNTLINNNNLKGGPTRNLKDDECVVVFDEIIPAVDVKVAISSVKDEEVKEEKCCKS